MFSVVGIQFKLGGAIMSAAWNLKELRAYIRTQRNADPVILELIDSVSRCDLIFNYHMITARDALKNILNYEEPRDLDNMMLILGGSDRQKDFQYAKVVSEANLIGCIHTTRNLLEIFAQLVNSMSLGGSIKVASCTPKEVAKKLPDSELKTQLNELLSSHWYMYTSAFTNIIKHRQLVQHQVSISLVDNMVGIKIGDFEYRGVSYQACWGNEFLQGVIDLKNGIVDLGRTLSRSLLPGAA